MSVYHSDSHELLTKAIDSILQQTVSCDLYLYQDGVIPDELQNALNKYSECQNVRFFHDDENKGLAYSLNFLIEHLLSGDYEFVARMDSDDYSYPQRLERQLLFFDSEKDVSVCGTFCREVGASYALEKKTLPVSHCELLNFSVSRCPFIHPSVMFRIDVFKHGYRYPTTTKLTEDMALWFQLLESGFKFGNVDEVLMDYMLTEDTVERRRGAGKAFSEFSLRMKYMIILKKVSLRNFFLVSSRLLFHFLPVSILRLAYKLAR
ncbi:glycosyltransferase [Aeromonas veronii]|uniref:glycosyltransferase n=1 Tax=Aeromonas veronii TaxID=654 RepID=UPI003D248971